MECTIKPAEDEQKIYKQSKGAKKSFMPLQPPFFTHMFRFWTKVSILPYIPFPLLYSQIIWQMVSFIFRIKLSLSIYDIYILD